MMVKLTPELRPHLLIFIGNIHLPIYSFICSTFHHRFLLDFLLHPFLSLVNYNFYLFSFFSLYLYQQNQEYITDLDLTLVKEVNDYFWVTFDPF